MTGVTQAISRNAMFEHLLRIRYLAVVIVLIAFLHALAFTVLGVITAIRAYIHIGQGNLGHGEVRPGIEMLQSLDVLLIALVLVIFAAGVAKIFLVSDNIEDSSLPAWLRIKSFSELKPLLWETILTAMLISFLPAVVVHVEDLQWRTAVLPACILLLAVSLYFMKQKSKH